MAAIGRVATFKTEDLETVPVRFDAHMKNQPTPALVHWCRTGKTPGHIHARGAYTGARSRSRFAS